MSSVANIFQRSVITDVVRIKPHELNRDFREVLLRRLQRTNEGKCTRHGYVRPNSIRLYRVSPGRVDAVSLNGDVIFTVMYRCDVCNPAIGARIVARVVNVNKFGILARNAPPPNSTDNDDLSLSSVLECIIPKQGVTPTTPTTTAAAAAAGIASTGNTVDDYDDENVDAGGRSRSTSIVDEVKIGDEVEIEIAGKKFELNDPRISVVGRLLGIRRSRASAAALPSSGAGNRRVPTSSGAARGKRKTQPPPAVPASALSSGAFPAVADDKGDDGDDAAKVIIVTSDTEASDDGGGDEDMEEDGGGAEEDEEEEEEEEEEEDQDIRSSDAEDDNNEDGEEDEEEAQDDDDDDDDDDDVSEDAVRTKDPISSSSPTQRRRGGGIFSGGCARILRDDVGDTEDGWDWDMNHHGQDGENEYVSEDGDDIDDDDLRRGES